MKKIIAIGLVLILALSLGAGAVSANSLFTMDLIAGGGSQDGATDIGDVQVWEDSGNLHVKYVVTEPNWVITHVHFHVADSPDDIPQNKGGNPKIGKFDYSIPFSPGVTEFNSGPISLAGLTFPVYIATQAEVYYNESVVYGIEYLTNEIHAINPISGNSTFVHTIPLALYDANASAFDSANNRLYYQEYSTKTLQFHDFAGNDVVAGTLAEETHSATWYNGKYYYVAEFTDDLYEVSFNATGNVVLETKLADISSDSRAFDFGDIAVASDGTIYGAATAGLTEVFFKVGTDGSGYTEIAAGDLGDWPIQLAFGSDGTLYGNYHATGKYFVVNLATGGTTEIATGSGYADLASGSAPTQFETAWGDGIEFPGRSWAMYVEYSSEQG